jgi:hypothetical protein
MFIRAVDETNHIATLSTDPRPSNKEKDARYFIENVPDALDAPGEWYLDRKTGVLSYIARPGEDLSKAEVIAPQLDQLLVLQGDLTAKQPIKHVILRGLTFSYTDWTMPADGYADTQAAVAVHGDVRAEGATDCALENCAFTHLAGYAVELGRGCQRDKVSGCDMFDLGTGGVRIGEPAKRLDAFEANHSHVKKNNVVYHCKSAGFHQHYGRENVIRNNVFAFNREHQLMRTRDEAHTSFFFTNNIVLFDSGDLLGSNWQGDHYFMDRNLYWDAHPRAKPGEMRFSGATLENWRLRGHDLHSLVADPLFVAPGNWNFRLKAGSPAFELGFKPIDLSGVGVRNK